MKFILLILFPSLSFCQSSYIIEDLTKEGSIQAFKMNLGKKFDVTGGTITGKTYFASTITITGTGGALIFPDGTQQLTAGVGESTITVTADQFTGNGSASSPLALVTSSVTLQGNTFNGNSQLVKTNSSGLGPVSITGNAATATSVPAAGVDLSTVTVRFVALETSTGTIDAAKVNRAGDTMTGQLTLSGSTLTVTGAGGIGATYGITAATFTGTHYGSGSNLTGIPASAITAGTFGTGDYTFTDSTMWLDLKHTGSGGSRLRFFNNAVFDSWLYDNPVGNVFEVGTNLATLDMKIGANALLSLNAAGGTLTGSASQNILKAGDTMTGQLTLSGSTLTVTGAGGIGATYGITAATFTGTHYGSGANLTGIPASAITAGTFGTGDYTFTNTSPMLTLNHTSGNSSSLRFTDNAVVKSNLSSISSISVFEMTTNLAELRINVGGSGNTLLGFNSIGMTSIKPLTLSGSTLTVTGSAFSVGTSTLVVTDGKVGIGTTNPGQLLDVSGGDARIRVTGTSAGTIQMQETAGTSTWFEWQTYLDGLRLNANTMSDIMNMTNSGLVGIGNAAPTTKLDVTGGGHFTSSMTVDGGYYGSGSNLTGVITSTAGLVAKSGDTMTGQLTLAGSTLTVTGNSSDGYGVKISSDIAFAGVLYTKNAKVGVGTTAPTAKMQVVTSGTDNNGISSFDARHFTVGLAGDGGATVLAYNSAGSFGSLYAVVPNIGWKNLSLSPWGGNVSIGGDASVNRFIVHGAAVIGDAYQYTTAPTESLLVEGSIGVGTGAPGAKLDVIGGISASGDIVSSGAFRGNGSNLTGVITSTATGDYLITVASATALKADPGACTAGQYVTDIAADGTLTCGTPAGAGNVVLAATQTFTGGNTFVQSSTFSGTINLPARDKIAFGNELHNSSSTTLATYGTQQTTFAECVTGSTLTITTQQNSRIMVGFSGGWTCDSYPYSAMMSFKVDGNSYAGNQGIVMDTWRLDSYLAIMPVSFTAITGVLSAGQHSVCLALRISNAAITATISVDANVTNQFWIQELR